MNRPLAAALQCLKAVCVDVSDGADADQQSQLRIAGRLLDYLFVQNSVALELKQRCYARWQTLLPEVETLVGKAPELEAVCAAADPADFERFAGLTADLQRRLLARADPAATQLARAIATIEADYHRDIEAAVVEQAKARPAATKASLSARNARDIDQVALLKFIRAAFPDERDLGIEQCAVISGGYSKLTVGIRLKNTAALPSDIILRADAAATYGGASSVDEYRLLKVLYEHGVRVPRPLAADETGAIIGSKFMIVERKPGGSIGHMFMLPQPNAAVCRDVAGQLAIIHRIPVTAFGDRVDNLTGSSSDKARAWIAEGLAAWKPLAMPSSAFEAAFDWLHRNAHLNDRAPRALVHGDIHLANMLVHDDRISTILDWEFAHIGNPAYDLGYFFDQAVALDSWDAFLAAYMRAGGIEHDTGQLDYAILFAATRLGVMTCQTISSFLSGAEPGLAGAAVVGHNFYDMTIKRIGRALERVL